MHLGSECPIGTGLRVCHNMRMCFLTTVGRRVSRSREGATLSRVQKVSVGVSVCLVSHILPPGARQCQTSLSIGSYTGVIYPSSRAVVLINYLMIKGGPKIMLLFFSQFFRTTLNVDISETVCPIYLKIGVLRVPDGVS